MTAPVIADLFPETITKQRQGKKPRRKLMHVADAGDWGNKGPICQMQCVTCGMKTDWMEFDTDTEAKRGIPCPKCNQTTN